jgi:hypothetical protein
MSLEACCRALGVDARATPDQIRKAYRRRVAACHPDLNGGDHSHLEEFERAQRAYRDWQSRRRGLGLHEDGKAAAGVDGEEGTTPAIPSDAERRHATWRRYGFLLTLSACVVVALWMRGGTAEAARTSAVQTYLGAIGAAAGLWGLGMIATGAWMRWERKEER